MKVGFVVDDHMGRPGGVQEYVRGLRRYLEASGHRTVIFSSSGGPSDHGVIPLGTPLPLRGSGSSTSIALSLHAPARLRTLLAREACDVLHVMAPYSPTLSGRLLVQSRAAHVMTFLVAIEPPWYRRLVAGAARTQQRSLRRFHARIAISHAARRSAHTLYGGRYTIIPPGVDIERFRPPASRSTSDEFTVVSLGRLERRKGVATLLHALALRQPDMPRVRLLVGGDGPERAALEHLATALGVRGAEFLGYVPSADLPALLHRADLFCAPATRAESFGIVLIEAMAAGLPIVAAANAGYAEVLGAHGGNELFPPGDARALAAAIRRFATSPHEARAVGQRNAAAAQQYSWDAVGAATLRVYDAARTARERGGM
jgi:phosphatidyl-myo-inositol alpha-mannosyltransferase